MRVLEENREEIAFLLEKMGEYMGEPMEIEVDIDKPILTPAHHMSAVVRDFAGGHCADLEVLWIIKPSRQSKYSSATVVVGKKDEAGGNTDYCRCGDYRQIDFHILLDRYPRIDDSFRDLKDAKKISKLDLR